MNRRMHPVLRWTLLVLFSPVLLPFLVVVVLAHLLGSAVDGEWK